MDITPYVDRLRHELESVAAAAGPDAAAAAERMTLALDPAIRMTMLEALSDAAAHISAQIPAGSIEVRLRGRDPEFVVDVPSPIQDDVSGPPPGPQDAEPEEESDVVRITLRLPESVKTRAEELASKSGRSLNAQMVTMLKSATRESGTTFEFDLGQFHPNTWGATDRPQGGRRMQGWI